MADYTKVYDGAAKDTGESVITGADFDTEFDAIETSNNTKADKDVPVATNSIGLLDVNGNLLSSEVLIDTDGTLAGNSDAAIPTEKAVKTYVDAATADTFASGTFTFGAVGTTSGVGVTVAHGFGNVPVDFGGAQWSNNALIEDVRIFVKYNGITYKQTIDQGFIAYAYMTPSLVDGEIGIIVYNNNSSFAETGGAVDWWVRKQ